MVDRLSEEEVEEVANLISGTIVPEVVRIADKFNYDRDSLMKYVANLFSTMAEFASFENWKGGSK
jgi:translation initiation factor 2 beta subunit (eIF-2beta)/eIF-5